jgi:hypothetical protein
MIENTGTFCSNFAYYNNKVKRITKALKDWKLSKNNTYLDQEIEIFLNDLENLPKVIQECANNMEKGLLRRKTFLEAKELETEYQEFKKLNK